MPALVIDDGTVITENTVVLPYLADLKPQGGLFAPLGSEERSKIQSWIGYLAFDVHAGCFRPIFRPDRYSADVSVPDGYRLLNCISNLMSPPAMTLTDAVLALLLTVRIHGTDDAVRATAKRCAKKLPRSKRDLMFQIVDSRAPHAFVVVMAQNLDL